MENETLKTCTKCSIEQPIEQFPKHANYKGGRTTHCHLTGKIRSLLCDRCNRGLGTFQDNRSLLAEAIKYLEKHSK